MAGSPDLSGLAGYPVEHSFFFVQLALPPDPNLQLYYYLLFGGLRPLYPPFFHPTRWLPRTPCSYDQRKVSGEPQSGFVDAEIQCLPSSRGANSSNLGSRNFFMLIFANIYFSFLYVPRTPKKHVCIFFGLGNLAKFFFEN